MANYSGVGVKRKSGHHIIRARNYYTKKNSKFEGVMAISVSQG